MYPRCGSVFEGLRGLAGGLFIVVAVGIVCLAVLSGAAYAQEGVFIKGVEPPEGECGTEMEVYIYGGIFSPDMSVAFLVDGVEVLYTEVIDDETLLVGIFISEEAPEGRWPVGVFGPEGEAVMEEAFTIYCPHEPPPPPPEEPTPDEPVPPPDEGGPPPDEGGPPPDEGGPPPDEGGPSQPEIGGGRGGLPIIPIIGAVVVVGTVTLAGLTLTVRHSMKVRTRREWERKAQEEKPREPCRASSRYCQKEVEVNLKRGKITEVRLRAAGRGSGRGEQEKGLTGKPANELDGAVVAHRLGRQAADLQERVEMVAGEVSRQIVAWLQGEKPPQEVAVDAHFEGVEVTLTFTLFRCVQKGPVTTWEEEDEWEVSYQQEHDEPVGTLFLQNPIEVGLAELITPDLARLLMQFVQRM